MSPGRRQYDNDLQLFFQFSESVNIVFIFSLLGSNNSLTITLAIHCVNYCEFFLKNSLAVWLFYEKFTCIAYNS